MKLWLIEAVGLPPLPASAKGWMRVSSTARRERERQRPQSSCRRYSVASSGSVSSSV